jgi:dTDP-3-amino-3,4,6-trideoxy-alpha-D-glucose transaminase
MILQNDFKRQWEAVGQSVLEAVERVGASGSYILGEEVGKFETALASLYGAGFAVGVANGMDAIEIGLRCLDLKPGEKVLTTPLSAFATTLAIVRAGGVPAFGDVDDLGGIDLLQCRDVLKKDSSIGFLLPVHLYGFPLDMSELAALKDEFNLKIVEDCAQAVGAASGNTRVGTVGQVGATSFYPTKNLGAMGDGGALLSNDSALAERARTLRNYGQSAHYLHDELGLNSRLDELHAAILHDAFLPKLGEWTAARKKTAQRYLDEIKHPLIELPRLSGEMNSVWHIFPTRIASGHRDSFRDYLRSKGILTGVHYPRVIPDQAAMQKCHYLLAVDPVKARQWATCEVSLPIHPFLTDNQISAVIEACNQWDA